jgi:hypothetical protein
MGESYRKQKRSRRQNSQRGVHFLVLYLTETIPHTRTTRSSDKTSDADVMSGARLRVTCAVGCAVAPRWEWPIPSRNVPALDGSGLYQAVKVP